MSEGIVKFYKLSNSLKLSAECYYQLTAMTAIIFSYNLQSSTSCAVVLHHLSLTTRFLSALPLNLPLFPLL